LTGALGMVGAAGRVGFQKGCFELLRPMKPQINPGKQLSVLVGSMMFADQIQIRSRVNSETSIRLN
jgi:hypothetical protein